jgi:uncharacterized protein (DUF433 family)
MNSNGHDYISVDFDIHRGEPCIKGTRIPVSVIVGSIKNRMSPDEIVR